MRIPTKQRLSTLKQNYEESNRRTNNYYKMGDIPSATFHNTLTNGCRRIYLKERQSYTWAQIYQLGPNDINISNRASTQATVAYIKTSVSLRRLLEH